MEEKVTPTQLPTSVIYNETPEVPTLHHLKSSDIPTVVKAAGSASAFAYEEFIFAKIRNRHTRRAYAHAVNTFLSWVHEQKISLQEVRPRNIRDYFDELRLAVPSKMLHRAALNHFFDYQVNRHAVLLNPVSSFRNERHLIEEGKTPEISVRQARELFRSIDVSTVVGIRDRAILATLAYSGSRIGAVAQLRVKDFVQDGENWFLAFNEKGGKHPKVPVRHDLLTFLRAYLEAAGIDLKEKDAPLFRTAPGRGNKISAEKMSDNDIHRMFKRRARAAGLPDSLTPHSFRVATITTLLKQDVPLPDVQNLANHADPRTTRLYDRRNRSVTRNIVERIPNYVDVK